MPYAKNHLPKYRKHRASGQAVVTLNGRDFYLGPHNTKASKLEYDRLIGEWLQNGRNPLLGTKSWRQTNRRLDSDVDSLA